MNQFVKVTVAADRVIRIACIKLGVGAKAILDEKLLG
jgi:hypothetical protein